MVERADDTLRIVFNSWRDKVHPLAGGSEVLIDRLAAGLVCQYQRHRGVNKHPVAAFRHVQVVRG